MATPSALRAARLFKRPARGRSTAVERLARDVLAFERLDARSMLAVVVNAAAADPIPPHEVTNKSEMRLAITFVTPNVVAGQQVGYDAGTSTSSDWKTYGLDTNLNVKEVEFHYLETSQFLVTSPTDDNVYKFKVDVTQNVDTRVWTGFVMLGQNIDQAPAYKAWGTEVKRSVTAEDPGQYTIVPCYLSGNRLVADATQSYALFLSVREGAQMHNARLLKQANELLASIVQQERDAGYPLNDNPRIEAQKAVVEAIESADPYVLAQNITLEDCKGATASEADANFAKVAGQQSDSHLNRPQYFADEDNGKKLSFKGTLCNVDAATGVNLFLGRETTLYVPLTNGMSTYSGTMYTRQQDKTFQYDGKTWTYRQALDQVLENLKTSRPTTWRDSSQQTQGLIGKIDEGGGVCFLGTSGPIAYKSLSWSYEINSRVDVGGYGRIDGGRLAAFKSSPVNIGTADPWTYYRLSDVLDSLEVSVGGGLLDIASSWNRNNAAAGNFAIDAWGVTVSQGPARGKGSVDLNTPWNSFRRGGGDPQPDGSLNNAPVDVSDLKVVANWKSAADGPEVMGEYSRMSNVYIHAADDSIKAAVSGLTVKEVTVLQGNAGGVIDFGSYGYSRPDRATGTVHNMTLEDIRVHRVTQTTGGYDESRGEGSWGNYDKPPGKPAQLNGLFTTRNGAFNPFTYGGFGGSIENVKLQGFGVADLGGSYAERSGLKGPNTFYRAYALGFIPNSYFGSSNENNHTDTWFKNWSFQFPTYVKNYLEAWGLVVATGVNSVNQDTNTDPSNYYDFGMQSRTEGKQFGNFGSISWTEWNPPTRS